MTIGEFAEAASMYCMIWGGSTTSWGRSKIHNEAVGGVSGSAHRFWRGLDVVYDDKATFTNPKRLIDATRLGLLLIPEADHDHLQPLGWAAG